MKSQTIYSLIFISALVFILFSFTQDKKDDLKFVIPKGWPKPFYDVSKNKITEAGFKLGRKLFFEPSLSRDSSINCSSCHLQFTGFTHVDHALSHGINGLKGTRNAPGLFNLAWSKSFMWDGGVNNLEVQPLSPIVNPVEMNNTMQNVVDRLSASANYRQHFKEAFGDTVITSQRVLKAIAQFVVLFESYNSKYDKYMRHQEGNEFSDQEKKGLQLFRDQCASCHKEPLFTTGNFENNGLPVDLELTDYGRMKITQDVNDYLKFKVPSLRNVAVSYPYMHDGRFKSLEQVLDHYTKGIIQSSTLAPQLKERLTLSEDDKKDIIAFLKTLTDNEFLFDLRFRDYPY